MMGSVGPIRESTDRDEGVERDSENQNFTILFIALIPVLIFDRVANLFSKWIL